MTIFLHSLRKRSRTQAIRIIVLVFAAMMAADILSAQERPNIILFLVDDMGWQDTSLPFWTQTTVLNKRYHTPNMERLAERGIMFTNAYATPVCTPTRVSIMTGMNAAHHGITSWTHIHKDTPTDQEDKTLQPANWNYNGLSPVKGVPHTVFATPLPQILKEHGYFTIHVGKAHWGSMGTPGSNPYNLGFAVNIAGNATGHPQSFRGEDNYGNLPGNTTFHAVQNMNEYYGTETFFTEALTLEAIKSLDAPIRNKQPFFLNLAHYAVHTPLQADPRFYKKSLDSGLDETEARYASMIEGMDKSLGDILDFIESSVVARNTIIIFMTDNGGLSLTPPRGGTAHTHNLPLRAGKGSVYEGGIRVPMIVRWDGVVKPRGRTDQYVIVEDFFPSILEMAGIAGYNTVQSVDGRSFVSLIRNPELKDNSRALIWHFPNKWQPDGPGINYKSAVRRGDWKGVYHMRDGKFEVFNLREDIGETVDVAARFPEIARDLKDLLSKQLRAWKAPMPLDIMSQRPVMLPDER
jgi:arylsulfatase A-like enzyme